MTSFDTGVSILEECTVSPFDETFSFLKRYLSRRTLVLVARCCNGSSRSTRVPTLVRLMSSGYEQAFRRIRCRKASVMRNIWRTYLLMDSFQHRRNVEGGGICNSIAIHQARSKVALLPKLSSVSGIKRIEIPYL